MACSVELEVPEALICSEELVEMQQVCLVEPELVRVLVQQVCLEEPEPELVLVQLELEVKEAKPI